MNPFLRAITFIEDGNLWTLLFLLLLLYYLGSYTARDYDSLRRFGKKLGLGAVLAYVAYGWSREQPASPDPLVPIVLRGLLAGGFVVSLSWIILPLLSFLDSQTLAHIRKSGQEARRRRDQERERKQEEREAEKRRLQAEKEYERQAPERERHRMERERQDEAARSAGKRRENARSKCELLYRKHAPEIKSRFTKKMLDEYMSKYLGDGQPADEVECRCEALKELILSHVEMKAPSPKFRTVRDVTEWYEREKAEAESVENVKTRAFLLTQLHEKYSDLLAEVME